MQIHHFTWQSKSGMQIMHHSHEECNMITKQQYPKIEQAQACLRKSPFAFLEILRLYLNLSHNLSIHCKSLKIGNVILLYSSWGKTKQNKKN